MDKRSLDGLALMHDLVPFLPVDRLHAFLNEETIPTKGHGSALFADISGFTMLAEALSHELGPERGAEELNSQINYTFVGLIDTVDRYHGSVIRFSGDGVTAWFAGDDGPNRAVIAALAMQAVMATVATVVPDLRLKIGIGTGDTYRFTPGNPAYGTFDVLAGPAVTQMSHAEGLASPGQIILCPQTSAVIGALFTQEAVADGYTLLKPTIFAPSVSARRWRSIRWMEHVERAWDLVEASRPYIPLPLYERLQSGHGTYMTDLRLVTPLFIRFTGIDYSTPDAPTKLDELVRVAQEIIRQHGGHLNEVGVGDKGSELVALFGAPVALENPPAQAAHAAAQLQEELPHVTSLHFGLTCDRLFTGTVGSPMRRAYAVIGDDVNLAARLMSKAGPNEVLANYRAFKLAADFAWNTLPPLRVKGKIAPVRVYQLAGLAENTHPLWQRGSFVTRTQELEALNWAVSTHQDGQSHILVMRGEPGLGKSHLLGEFEAMIQERGITCFTSIGRQVEQPVPYRVWRDVFEGYFEIDAHATANDRQKQITARLEQIAPQLALQAPLLNNMLQVNFLDNRFTASLSPAERHSALVNLVIALLRTWLEEDALAIVLDNAQWLDTLSWDLAYQVARNIPDQQLTILFSMRPFKENPPAAYRLLSNLEHVRQFQLQTLNPADTEILAAEHLAVETVPEQITQLILQKTGGNPLFIKEVITVLLENGIIAVEDGQVLLQGDPNALALPDTVQGIVRTRLDRLPPDQQILLKVASVIGNQFNFRTLLAIQPLRLNERNLRTNLNALDSMDLHLVEKPKDGSGNAIYAFKYAITREVAYNSLSFAQRRQIHQATAQWYEQEYRYDLIPYYALLAHHWQAAEDLDKELWYAYLLAVNAANQYANDDAITYFNRTLELTATDNHERRYDILLRLEDLYHLAAARQEQHATLIAINKLAKTKGGHWQAHTATLWARYYESIAEYDASIAAADESFAAAFSLETPEAMGLSAVYQGLGLMHLGRYEEARQTLLKVYAVDVEQIEAWRLDVLGQTLARMGDHSAAQEVYAQAQKQANIAGNRAVVGRILNNMGDSFVAQGEYEKAEEYYSRALRIRLMVGDRRGEAASLNSLGNLSLNMGDYNQAQEYFSQTYEIFQAIGDRAMEAQSLLGIGRVTYERQDFEMAREYLQAALTIQRYISDHRNTGITLIHLSIVEMAQQQLPQAHQHLTEALQLSSTVAGATAQHLTFIGGALFGQLAYRQGHIEEALARLTTTWQLIEQHGLANLPDSLLTSLITIEVLTNCGQQDAADILLADAYDLLHQRANQLSNPEYRARYLFSIACHRNIANLYEQKLSPAP